MNIELDNANLRQAKLGRHKLRQGSLIVIVTMLFDALFCLYFVMTAKPETKEFAISPGWFSIILLVTIPILIIGILLMIKGFRMETQGYAEELKQAEKQLKELTNKVKLNQLNS